MDSLTVLGIPVTAAQVEQWLEYYCPGPQPFCIRDLTPAQVKGLPSVDVDKTDEWREAKTSSRSTAPAWEDGGMQICWPLSDGRVTVRPAVVDDAEAVAAYQRLPESQEYTNETAGTAEAAASVIRERTDDPDALMCVIVVGGQVVGQIGGRRARPYSVGPKPDVWDFSLGYIVAPSHWGQGIASAAIGLLVPALHDQAGIRRISAKVYTENTPSIRVLLRNGFNLEGTEKALVMGRDGRWLDDSTLAHFPDGYDA